MIPFLIAAAGVVAVGAYLLDDASSNNTKAKKKYKDTVTESKSTVKNYYAHAQRKDTLDKLFKVKKAKRKIADTFYQSLKSNQKSFIKINEEIKISKDLRASMLNKKSLYKETEEKRTIQESIHLLQLSRKHLFLIKDTIHTNMEKLKLQLTEANAETRKIQDQINIVLS